MRTNYPRLSNAVRFICIFSSLFAIATYLSSLPVLAGQAVASGGDNITSAGNSSGARHVSGGPVTSVNDEKYLIGPGDMLAINVWKDPEISRTMPVRPDGRISLPLIGEIQASGLSTVQLRNAIVQKLERYISHPEVNVSVQEIKSRSFNIIGRVMKAGEYDLPRPTTVIDAIAMAGGFQDFAHVKKIYILRSTDGGAPTILHFNYKQVIKGHDLKQNVDLQPGDTIVVP